MHSLLQQRNKVICNITLINVQTEIINNFTSHFYSQLFEIVYSDFVNKRCTCLSDFTW